MGLLDAVNFADPRLAPGAYLHDGKRLVEVVTVTRDRVTLLNCKTDGLTSTSPWDITRSFKLVRPAPAVPDTPQSQAESD